MRWGLGDVVFGGTHAAVVDGTSHGTVGAVFMVAVVGGCCSSVAGVVAGMVVVGALVVEVVVAVVVLVVCRSCR